MPKGKARAFSWSLFTVTLIVIAGVGAGLGALLVGTAAISVRSGVGGLVGGAILAAGGFAATVVATRSGVSREQLRKAQTVAYLASGAVAGVVFAIIARETSWVLPSMLVGAALGLVVSRFGFG